MRQLLLQTRRRLYSSVHTRSHSLFYASRPTILQEFNAFTRGAASTAQNHGNGFALTAATQRILHVVQNRVEERQKLVELATQSLQDDYQSNVPLHERIVHAKVMKEVEPLNNAWNDWMVAQESLTEAETLLQDEDPLMRSLAEEEKTVLQQTLTTLTTSTFPELLVPPSSTAPMSAFMELKSGVGGDEASLFLGEMMRMYIRLATSRGWKATIVSSNELEGLRGGMKDAILEITGPGSYDWLRWESGVHRVQRVPATESGGRVHTSTIAIVVLPTSNESPSYSGADEPDPEELKIDEKDVKTEVMRSRGAGGQHVNKTESAVRLTHLPTGITVSMQDSRSQHQNRAKAWRILRARLMDRKLSEEVVKRRDTRRSLVKGADRSEKIRTYNWAQGRVTDHRISMSILNLDAVMEGVGLEDIIDGLQREHHANVVEDLLAETDS